MINIRVTQRLSRIITFPFFFAAIIIIIKKKQQNTMEKAKTNKQTMTEKPNFRSCQKKTIKGVYYVNKRTL